MALPSERLQATRLSASPMWGDDEFDVSRATVRERLALAAGALQCLARMMPEGVRRVVHFNGRWAHLGSVSVRRILNACDDVLEATRCDGCRPAPVHPLLFDAAAALKPAQICAGEDGCAGSAEAGIFIRRYRARNHAPGRTVNMRIKLTEHAACGRPSASRFTDWSEFARVNAGGISPEELNAIVASLDKGETYRLDCGVGAFCDIKRAAELKPGDAKFLRLLKLSPFQQQSGRWRFGTRRVHDDVVARLIASGAARREGEQLHLVTEEA